VSSNSLTIINGTVQDSGDYACVAEVSPVSVSSNIARLTVYGKSKKQKENSGGGSSKKGPDNLKKDELFLK